jgi:hypothetical protein
MPHGRLGADFASIKANVTHPGICLVGGAPLADSRGGGVEMAGEVVLLTQL